MSLTSSHRILVADDQQDILEALEFLLQGHRFAVDMVSSPAAAVRKVEQVEFDLALIDLNFATDTTSGQEGFDLLDRLKMADPSLPVIVMTGWSSVPVAVEAMRRGAKDFVEKPWDNARLISLIRTQLELRRALQTSSRLQAQNARLQQGDGPALIAASSALRSIIEVVEAVAPSDASVLITGENGTGKEVIAQLLHRRSKRAAKALVTINAGGLSEGIVESELFGHIKGAFTDARTDRIGCFEMADEGTLFLDEIANMPVTIQPKLLRVLQTGEVQRVGSTRPSVVNVRVVSATNADLESDVSGGRFREDLLYRLNTVVIDLPPLRSRAEDLRPLADHYLKLYSDKYRRRFEGFDASASDAMARHPWPGNVRELAHAVERAVLLGKTDTITAVDLGLRGAKPAEQLDAMSLEDAEKVFIQKVLARHAGDVRSAAEQLGMSKSTLYRRLQHFGLGNSH